MKSIIVGERAKREKHSQVCSLEIHDIYIFVVQRVSARSTCPMHCPDNCSPLAVGKRS